VDLASLLVTVKRWQEWLNNESGEAGEMPEWPAVRVVDWEAVA
jgi:hypothetical protein